MGKGYRNWEERREIIRSVIAESNPRPLETFKLSKSEEVFFRARSARIVEKLAHDTSAFKAYYALPVARPFKYVLFASGVMIVSAILAATYLFSNRSEGSDPTPIITACIAVIVAAVGWAVSGGLAHRNTIRQNTNTMLFARFSQAPFGEAVHRFFTEFGDTELVTSDRLNGLRASGKEEDRKAVGAVGYLLNYYEFISAGVLSGDLNAKIIQTNIRGVICYFHDRCEPHIRMQNRRNPKTFENLLKIRTHYREP